MTKTIHRIQHTKRNRSRADGNKDGKALCEMNEALSEEWGIW